MAGEAVEINLNSDTPLDESMEESELAICLREIQVLRQLMEAGLAAMQGSQSETNRLLTEMVTRSQEMNTSLTTQVLEAAQRSEARTTEMQSTLLLLAKPLAPQASEPAAVVVHPAVETVIAEPQNQPAPENQPQKRKRL